MSDTVTLGPVELDSTDILPKIEVFYNSGQPHAPPHECKSRPKRSSSSIKCYQRLED